MSGRYKKTLYNSIDYNLGDIIDDIMPERIKQLAGIYKLAFLYNFNIGDRQKHII